MKTIGVMHITDTLDAGGLERVSVNLVNLLPRERFRTYLCTTRRDGVLADLVAADVGRLRLERQRRFDMMAMRRLVTFIRTHEIQILHAHGTSLFIAVVASFFPPHPKVIWHDHFGPLGLDHRREPLYRLTAPCISGVIAVNQRLAGWSRQYLHARPDRVWYIPNFVCEVNTPENSPTDLPGKAGSRIVCVANIRPPKDHPTLLRAMTHVIAQVPSAHLLLIGKASNSSYLEFIQKVIHQLGLSRSVTLLGQRRDVASILSMCDIGVLSSSSEGFPLALIEYGMAALPSVATRVGQCSEILDNGQVGILVPSDAPDQLAAALLTLLKSPERRADLGEQFYRRVQAAYSSRRIIEQICRVYDTVLD